MLLVLAVRRTTRTAQRLACSTKVERRIRCLPHRRFASHSGKWGLSSPNFRNGRECSSSSRGGERDVEFEWAGRETVDVRCGGSGFITLDIFNSSCLSDPRTPLLVYFPPAGTHLSDQNPPIPPYLLTNHSALVRVNYRWNIPTSLTKTENSPLSSDPKNTAHPFPTPIHDTLHAWSFLLERFNPPTLPPQSDKGYTSSPVSSLKRIQRPILLYGSYLGSSLATSLALTESYASKTHPVRISGLISRSGVYDWVEAGTTPTLPSNNNSPLSESTTQPTSLPPEWDLSTLISHRQSLFPHPGYTFDAFASPALFFRTAGAAVPKTWESLSPSSTTSQSSSPEQTPEIELDIWDSYDESDGSFLNSSTKGRTEEVDLDPVARKANLKFPPKDSGLKIPRALFLCNSGGKGEEKRQAEELARLMRRSIVLHEFRDRVMWDEEADPVSVSQARVQVRAVSGEEGEEEEMVREWIEEALG